MAPQKPKRPSMLQRQRQLRAQQQQVKRASSKQLPASGDSSGNSRQARGQRANTSRAQAANNQRIINRGIEGFIRRGNAQDKLDKAAQGTRGSGTRTAGAGGGLARRPSSTVATTNRGTAKPPKPAALPPGQRGGALATRPSASPAKPQPKPPAQRGGAIEKAGPTIDVKANTPKVGGGSPAKPPVRTGQPGPNRAALPPGRTGGAPANASGSVMRAGARAAGTALGRAAGAANIIGTGLLVADQASRVFNPKDNLLTSLQQLGRSVSKATGDTSASGGRPGYRRRGGTAPTKPRVSNIPPAEGTGRGGPSDIKRTKPKPPARSASSTSSSTSSSRPQSSPSRSTPSRVSSPSANAGMKNQDKNYRGNLFEKTFGYKPGQAPDQTKNKPSSFDTKSDLYTPSTKVDGSKLDALKIDQKKVSEYKRRKDRYYS